MTVSLLTEPNLPQSVPHDAVRVAAVQMDVKIGRIADNVDRCIEFARAAAAQGGASLVLFPECSLTGYCFKDAEEAKENALHPDSSEFKKLLAYARESGQVLLVGLLESVPDLDEGIANTAMVVTPEGIKQTYRKTHLPFLGVDRWTSRGCGPLAPVQAGGVSLGTLICYDASFPEAARTLTLKGMELLAIPTNWPAEAVVKADWLPNTRAYENVVYTAAINRVGEERGFVFHGRSRACDPSGTTLVQGPTDAEGILVFDVFPERARQKRIERRGSEYWVDRIGHRRPDLYEDMNAARHEG